MDVELARTFLEIMSAGSFLEAADRLHVTQTAVTARISSLEAKLDCKLFVRNRSGAKLTPDGERFVDYATSLVQLWDRAQIEMKLPSGVDTRLCIGGETSLWTPLMVNWVLWAQKNIENIALHTEVADPENLIEKLGKNSLDAVIVHRPNYYSGFVVEQLMEEKLIHVRSVKNPTPDLFVDWGPAFRDQFDAALPQPRQTTYSFNFGPLALQVLLQKGGNGYFRTRVVKQYIERGMLERVPGAPEFTHPVYLLYRQGEMTESLQKALMGLRLLASEDSRWFL
ncbi:LysR family transcriptional regulator [Alkalimarinus alittae]|uniref:LysR family transcriptional regulator n=1 Tax=Alkalimarinus alittae TaxID=2961619 RepID=A0ABY6N4C2_9ALTE|nr:LysR family transcriptional regulator [Alkalimarinus alittae]UZE96966.1 LysR family transcriptional regulator [Alkalimarinus alittae]